MGEAHTDSRSLASVGNRIADFVAQHYSSKNPSRRHDHHLEPLPLVNEEVWVALFWCDKLVTGDPRKYCRRLLNVKSIDRWCESGTQSLFSVLPAECKALWKFVVMTPHAQHHSGFVLRLLTDTLSWRRKDSSTSQYHCRKCDTILDTAHLADCIFTGVRMRRATGSSHLRALLRSSSSSLDRLLMDDSKWAGDAIRPILVVTGLLSATSTAMNIGPMFGLFTDTTASAALRRFDVLPDARPLLLSDLRSCLVSWAAAAWTEATRHSN